MALLPYLIRRRRREFCERGKLNMNQTGGMKEAERPCIESPLDAVDRTIYEVRKVDTKLGGICLVNVGKSALERQKLIKGL
jgi:hypothetical protein